MALHLTVTLAGTSQHRLHFPRSTHIIRIDYAGVSQYAGNRARHPGAGTGKISIQVAVASAQIVGAHSCQQQLSLLRCSLHVRFSPVFSRALAFIPCSYASFARYRTVTDREFFRSSHEQRTVRTLLTRAKVVSELCTSGTVTHDGDGCRYDCSIEVSLEQSRLRGVLSVGAVLDHNIPCLCLAANGGMLATVHGHF